MVRAALGGEEATIMRSIVLGFVFACVAVAGCAVEAEPVGPIGAAVGGKPCASSAECAASQYCTTEDGVCNRPPGCRPGEICPAVCYGTCARDEREQCGDVTCRAGDVCCNASCGICTEPGGFCTQQICDGTPL